MTVQIQGEVTAVVTEVQGGAVQSWTGNVMVVANAADFNRDGGSFSPDGGTTVHTFSNVVEGDLEEDPDIVYTDQEAPANWPTEETWVDIWPHAVDVTAEVKTDEDDTLPATVPHSLRAVLVEGVRDEANRERVIVEQRGFEWVVADVVGRGVAIDMEVVTDLVPTLDQHRTDIDQAYAEASSANTVLADQQAALDAQKADLVIQQAALNQQKADLTAAQNAINDQQAALTAEQQAREAALASTQQDLDRAKTDMASADQAIADALAQARADLQAADKATNDSLAQTVTVVQQNKDAAAQDLATAKAQLQTADQALQSMDARLLSDVAAAYSLAVGKNTVTYSTSAASGTTGRVAGDTWFRQDASGNVIAVYKFDGTAWALAPVSGTALVADSVTATKIAAGAVTASELAANAVVAGKIAAGVVTANELASKAVTTDKLAAGAVTATQIASGTITADRLATGVLSAQKVIVADPENLIPNGDFSDGGDGWGAGVAAGLVTDQATDTDKSSGITRWVRMPSRTTSPFSDSQFDVIPNTPYLLEFWMRNPSPPTGTGGYVDPSLRTKATLRVIDPVQGATVKLYYETTGRKTMSNNEFYANHQLLGTTYALNAAEVMHTEWRKYAFIVLPGAYTSKLTLPDLGVVQGNVDMARFRLRNMVSDASLIVDGTITGAAIAAGTITSKNIAAKSITGDRIVSYTITTDQLRVGAGGNVNPDPDFTIPDMWDLSGSWTSNSGGHGRPGVLVMPNGSSASLKTNNLIPVVPGSSFRISVWLRGGVAVAANSLTSTFTATPTNDGLTASTPCQVLRGGENSSGANTYGTLTFTPDPTNFGGSTKAPANTWVQMTGYVQIPDNCFWLDLTLSSAPTSGSLDVSDLVIQQAVDSSVLVGGVIQAEELRADAFGGGDFTGDTLTVTGLAKAGTLQSTGAVNAASAAITGNAQAANLTATSTVQGATVKATSSLQTVGLTATGAATAKTLTTTGLIKGSGLTSTGDLQTSTATVAGALDAGSVTAGTVTSTGSVNGNSGVITNLLQTGSISSGDITSSGALNGASGAITNGLTVGTINSQRIDDTGWLTDYTVQPSTITVYSNTVAFRVRNGILYGRGTIRWTTAPTAGSNTGVTFLTLGPTLRAAIANYGTLGGAIGTAQAATANGTAMIVGTSAGAIQLSYRDANPPVNTYMILYINQVI